MGTGYDVKICNTQMTQGEGIPLHAESPPSPVTWGSVRLPSIGSGKRKTHSSLQVQDNTMPVIADPLAYPFGQVIAVSP